MLKYLTLGGGLILWNYKYRFQTLDPISDFYTLTLLMKRKIR